MIRRLEEENLTYAFPEVAFDDGYVIATYQAKVKTSNIERLAMAIADEQTTGFYGEDPPVRGQAGRPL